MREKITSCLFLNQNCPYCNNIMRFKCREMYGVDIIHYFYNCDNHNNIEIECDCCKKIIGVFVGDNKKNKPEYKNRTCKCF